MIRRLANLSLDRITQIMTDDSIEPSDDKAWEELVKNMLRAEMMRRGVSYTTLVERLAQIGIVDNELNLRNKVSRGRFTAVFFMQCMKALGADWINVPASVEEAGRKGGAQAIARSRPNPSATGDAP
jgi:Domain of unknown function (DUF6471)